MGLMKSSAVTRQMERTNPKPPNLQKTSYWSVPFQGHRLQLLRHTGSPVANTTTEINLLGQKKADIAFIAGNSLLVTLACQQCLDTRVELVRAKLRVVRVKRKKIVRGIDLLPLPPGFHKK